MTVRRPSAVPAGSRSRLLVMPADEVERWRVFVAVETPDPVRDALTGPLASLQQLGDVIRINPVDRMHLTLHFLGLLSRPIVEQLAPALAPVVARHRRFALTAQGVGAFPAMARRRVLWAGITGADLPRLNA